MADRPPRRVVEIESDGPDVPMELARLHRELETGDETAVRLSAATAWSRQRRADVVAGAGFQLTAGGSGPEVSMQRLLTLPDTVGPDMRMLVCGLNPSIHAANNGVGFSRPGNRFWPAVVAAGIVTADRDPDRALRHGLGMTDLVKRATTRAAEVGSDEFSTGLRRVERLVEWLEPALVCVVGLAGWRAAVARRATAGIQDRRIGGRRVYLMPSTSGLNAHSGLEQLTEHVALAWAAAR